MISDGAVSRRALRTPRAAAVAGLVFGVLLITALVLFRLAVPATPKGAGSWLSESSRRDSVLLALNLVPYAGIAFLWFIGVVRDRIGEAEDRFFATVFLGSGLLFVGMLFVAAATAAGMVANTGQGRGGLVTTDTWRYARQVTYAVMNVYAMRMAAVFAISTSTILLRSRVVPRWIALAGYAIAVVLLLTVGSLPWIELLFPAWVLLLSTYILVETFLRTRHTLEPAPSAL
jgi:hypothetical protein